MKDIKNFKNLNITLIGGGTGLSTLIMGLKKLNNKISAIVTVTDDGGSSGRLRKEYDIIPPGDIRNCLVALAKEDNLMSNLFSHRFGGSGDIAGHNFGNLFIMAMSEIFESSEKGIAEASKILAIKGNVIPSTFSKVDLIAESDNGDTIHGETKIGQSHGAIKKLEINPKNCKAAPPAIDAINNADLIILGPGSFYTSIISNLLIKDIVNTLKNSTAKKIFICNIMSEPGETHDYYAEDYLNILKDYIGKNIIDYILINNSDIPENLIQQYKSKNSHPVKFNNTNSYENTNIITGDFFSKHSPFCTESLYAKHDPEKLAKGIQKIYEYRTINSMS